MKSDNNTGTLYEGQNKFLIISHSVILRMRNDSYKISRKNEKFYAQYLPEIRAVYEIMWKDIVERCRPQMTIWCMRFACWIPKATNTHSQYVILIAFPLQQWLHQRVSMFRYKYIACLVTFNNTKVILSLEARTSAIIEFI